MKIINIILIFVMLLILCLCFYLYINNDYHNNVVYEYDLSFIDEVSDTENSSEYFLLTINSNSCTPSYHNIREYVSLINSITHDIPIIMGIFVEEKKESEFDLLRFLNSRDLNIDNTKVVNIDSDNIYDPKLIYMSDSDNPLSVSYITEGRVTDISYKEQIIDSHINNNQ